MLPARYFIFAMLCLLSACGSDSHNNLGDGQAQDTGATRFLAIKKHPAFSALIQSIECDSVKKSASAYVFQARVTRKEREFENSWKIYNDLIRIVVDPKSQNLRATVTGKWGQMNYMEMRNTDAYSVSQDRLEIKDFARVSLAEDGVSMVVTVKDGEEPGALIKSSAPLNSVDDQLDYKAFCGL